MPTKGRSGGWDELLLSTKPLEAGSEAYAQALRDVYASPAEG